MTYTSHNNNLIHTANLFEAADRIDDELIPKGSLAVTAATIAPDNDFVEIFEVTRPRFGVKRYTYEFRGLGLEDVALVTRSDLSTPSAVLAAIHTALQIKSQELHRAT